eukprot:3941356-Rhodomonas_salina.3
MPLILPQKLPLDMERRLALPESDPRHLDETVNLTWGLAGARDSRTPPNPAQETACAVQFVLGMRFLVFCFGVHAAGRLLCQCAGCAALGSCVVHAEWRPS